MIVKKVTICKQALPALQLWLSHVAEDRSCILPQLSNGNALQKVHSPEGFFCGLAESQLFQNICDTRKVKYCLHSICCRHLGPFHFKRVQATVHYWQHSLMRCQVLSSKVKARTSMSKICCCHTSSSSLAVIVP